MKNKTTMHLNCFLGFIVFVSLSFNSITYAGQLTGSLGNGGKISSNSKIKPERIYYERINHRNFQKNNLAKTLNSDAIFSKAFQIGGSKITQIGGTAVDADGNYYVTGGYTGTVAFGSDTITSSNGYDFYIAKYDKNENCIWVRTARGSTSLDSTLAIEGGIAIKVDSIGDCYVGGAFVKTMTFLNDSAKDVITLSDGRNDNTINFEMFVAKYNSSGTLIWARGGNSGSTGNLNNLRTGFNGVTSIILDSQGYPYIGGRYSGTDFLGDSVGTQGGSDFFIASLDPENGNPDWEKLVGTPSDDGVLSLSIDKWGYINALGYIGTGNLVLPENNSYNNNTGSQDTFIMSYDINGNWYFASIIGGGEDIVGNDIASDSVGNIYVTGDFSGTASFVGSNLTVTSTTQYEAGYLVKYDLNGNALWVRKFGDQYSAKGSRVVVDAQSNSYVVGTFMNEAVFGEESVHPDTLFAYGSSDMFMAKYDSSGNFQWVKQITGSGTESLDLIASQTVPVYTNPVQLASNQNKIILSGDFNKQLSLDNITLDAGVNDRSGFVASININGSALAVNNNINLPGSFSLKQNFPNPFNPTTTINYVLATKSEVNLDVYNTLGQKVRTLVNGQFSAGEHSVHFDANNLASGVYIYRLKAGNFVQTKKLILLK